MIRFCRILSIYFEQPWKKHDGHDPLIGNGFHAAPLLYISKKHIKEASGSVIPEPGHHYAEVPFWHRTTVDLFFFFFFGAWEASRRRTGYKSLAVIVVG